MAQTESNPPVNELQHSPGLPEWLAEQGVSLALTRSRPDSLVLIGQEDGRLRVVERSFDRASAVHTEPGRIWLASRYQLWRMENVLEPGGRYRRHDCVFSPLEGRSVGEIDIPDLALSEAGRPVFVNQTYSCIGRLSDTHSFEVVWKPSFISRLCAEDRCRLSGLALVRGELRFVTAAARSDSASGWKRHRMQGGVVLDVVSNEVIAKGLCLPHAPRWYKNELFVLNSGQGEIGRIDGSLGTYESMAELPGFTRGLAFVGDVAVVGVSGRSGRQSQDGIEDLPVGMRLASQGLSAECGVYFVDLSSGETRHWLRWQSSNAEIVDLAVITQCERPYALDFHDAEIQGLVTFEEGGGRARHLNAIEDDSVREGSPGRPETARPASASGPPILPPPASSVEVDAALSSAPKVWMAPVEKLVESHLAMTFPSLERRIQTRSLQEVLLATLIPGLNGPAALSLTEITTDKNLGEVLSFWVRPDLRTQGVGLRLLEETTAAIEAQGAAIAGLVLRSTWKHCSAMERLVVRAEWKPAEARRLSCRLDMEEFIRLENELERDPLPEGFVLVPWCEVSEPQKEGIRLRQAEAIEQGKHWFPAELSPFQLEDSHQLGPSAALLVDGEVAGWMVCHVVSEDSVQYTALFVDPALRKKYLALELCREVYCGQMVDYKSTQPQGLRYLLFLVDTRNEPMVHWLQARMGRFRPSLAELRWTQKILDSERAGERAALPGELR